MTEATTGRQTASAGFTPLALPANPFAAAEQPQLDAIARSQHQALTAWVQLNKAVLESVGKWQQEASRFVIRRLEDDLERQQRLIESRSPEEAWQGVADFARRAVEDYADEAGRMSEIAAEMQYACAGFGEQLAATTISRKPAA